jgi:hypothetical protein
MIIVIFCVRPIIGVTPVDRPVVPKAEATSKNASHELKYVCPPEYIASSTDDRSISVPPAIMNNDTTVATSAALTVDFGIRLLNINTLSLPLEVAHIVAITIASVVVLTPPAVDAGEEPANIMNDHRNLVLPWNILIGIVANPAFLVENVENIIP